MKPNCKDTATAITMQLAYWLEMCASVCVFRCPLPHVRSPLFLILVRLSALRCPLNVHVDIYFILVVFFLLCVTINCGL